MRTHEEMQRSWWWYANVPERGNGALRGEGAGGNKVVNYGYEKHARIHT